MRFGTGYFRNVFILTARHEYIYYYKGERGTGTKQKQKREAKIAALKHSSVLERNWARERSLFSRWEKALGTYETETLTSVFRGPKHRSGLHTFLSRLILSLCIHFLASVSPPVRASDSFHRAFVPWLVVVGSRSTICPRGRRGASMGSWGRMPRVVAARECCIGHSTVRPPCHDS